MSDQVRNYRFLLLCIDIRRQQFMQSIPEQEVARFPHGGDTIPRHLGLPTQQHQSRETTNRKLTLKETLLQAQKRKVRHSRFCFVTLTQTLKARAAAARAAAAARTAAARTAATAARAAAARAAAARAAAARAAAARAAAAATRRGH